MGQAWPGNAASSNPDARLPGGAAAAADQPPPDLGRTRVRAQPAKGLFLAPARAAAAGLAFDLERGALDHHAAEGLEHHGRVSSGRGWRDASPPARRSPAATPAPPAT